MTINKSSIISLISTSKNSVIKRVFNGESRITKEILSDNNEVDEIDLINIDNLRSIKINSRSQFKITKSKNSYSKKNLR